MTNIQSEHPVVSRFIDYLKYEKRFSPHTVRAYQDDLAQFYVFLAGTLEMEKPEPPEIASSFIRSWLASLKEDNATAKTINRKISTLRSFFKFCIREEMLEKSPMANIGAPKIPARLPHYVEQKDISTLFNHVEFPGD